MHHAPILYAFLSPLQLILVACIGLIVFGAKGLPSMGKMLGETVVAFKGAANKLHEPADAEKPAIEAPKSV